MADTKNKTKTTVKKVAKTPAKAVVKKVSKTAVKVTKPAKTVAATERVKASKSKTVNKTVSVKVAVYGANGVSKGSLTLPSEIFGASPNHSLIAQAVRVYLANQRQGNAATKTRSEVTGSTRKIYRQKGTGRARHGALKAPIFVGGGVAHGPRPHGFSLDFPKKMKKQALISALSQKANDGLIKIVDGDFSGKTKEVGNMLKKMELTVKGKTSTILFVVDDNANAKRAAHNIKGVEIENASTLSTYGVVANKNLILMKNSLEKITERLKNN